MAYTMQAARQAAGKTAAEMAEILGISRDAYRELEQHPERVTVGQARQFSQSTGIGIDALYFFAREST